MGILKGQCHKINYHVGSCKLSFSPEQGLYTGFKFVKSSLKRQKWASAFFSKRSFTQTLKTNTYVTAYFCLSLIIKSTESRKRIRKIKTYMYAGLKQKLKCWGNIFFTWQGSFNRKIVNFAAHFWHEFKIIWCCHNYIMYNTFLKLKF